MSKQWDSTRNAFLGNPLQGQLLGQDAPLDSRFPAHDLFMSTIGFANPVMCAHDHDLEEQIFTLSKVFGEANTSFNTGRSASSSCSMLHCFIVVLLIYYATPRY